MLIIYLLTIYEKNPGYNQLWAIYHILVIFMFYKGENFFFKYFRRVKHFERLKVFPVKETSRCLISDFSCSFISNSI